MPVRALFLITLVILSVGAIAYVSQLPAEDSPASLRNIGRSQYEEEKYEEAAKSFERILSVDPNSAIDHLNLGIVLVQLEKFPEAREHLEKGESLDASLAPHAAYNLALTYKRERNFAEAAKEFERLLKLDPVNPDAVYNLAVVYEGLSQLPKAFELASRSVELLPDEVAPHYRRMMLAVRLGKLDIANQEKAKMAELRAQDARNRTPAELEMSVYTEIVEPDRTRRVTSETPRPSPVKFQDVSESVGLKTAAEGTAGGQVSWVDLDGDGRQDLAAVFPGAGGPRPSLRLWTNRTGGFQPLTLPGPLSENLVSRAGWGDLDHDGDQDLCASVEGRILSFLNDGTGNLVQKSESKLTAGVADILVVDFDHDGDLDIYVALIGAPPLMLQNDGQGSLTPLEKETGLAAGGRPARRLVRLDFDDDNDTDFFIGHDQGPNSLLSNLRVGAFRDIATTLGIDQPSALSDAVSADLNNDVWPDLVVIDKQGAVTALMGQKTGKFERMTLPAAPGGGALEVFDVDNDGDEDLLAGTRLFQNDWKFTDFTQAYGLALATPVVSAGAEDYDQDGDYDLAVVQQDGALRLLRNEGGNRNRWLRVSLEGLQSNRFGVGTKVEIRENSFFQRKISEGRPLLFGLGQYNSVDVLRMWWPTGVAQNILAPTPERDNPVREKLGPPSSCPYIYVWNGREFEFFTDVLDATALGVPLGNGKFWPHADKEDLVIPGSLLREKDGELLIQMTGELREVVYLDRLRLTAIDHPSDVSVVSLDAAGVPPDGRSRLVEISKRVVPTSARDEKGNDWRPALISSDRRHAQGFKLTRFNGLTETHGLLLDFNIPSGVDSPVLALTGWVNWMDGDTLYAIGGGAGPAPFGPRIEIRVEGGRWRLVTETPGLPPGIGKTLVVPLPDDVLGRHIQVRITTNMEVYWDSITVAHSDAVAGTVQALAIAKADLHFRGFSKLDRKAANSPPWYDYRIVSASAPWKGQRGFFTKYGGVLDLLGRADDHLVVFGPGDELTLRFKAPQSAPAAGWVRDYVLRVDGWIKDANATTHRGDTVEPLPYRGMATYPPDRDRPVSDTTYWETVDEYNTRTLR